MRENTDPGSAFGRRLRRWRKARAWSQLELAAAAKTTPRHVSFLETGRSRPGREIALRLGRCLELPRREQNALLTDAGLAPAFDELPLEASALSPFLDAIRLVLDRHEPYPACALDAAGRVHLANGGHRRLIPGAVGRSPEESIDAFYGELGRRALENFAEVAWAELDRRTRIAHEVGSPELLRLAQRAHDRLRDVGRPPETERAGPVVCARLRAGGHVLHLFTVVMRFDSAREVTMSELRAELMFPADDATARLLRSPG